MIAYQQQSEVALTTDEDIRSMEVLVAEDNIVNQQIIKRTLQRIGCHCRIVSNGRKAVAACAEKVYDIILMDMHMPDMNGITATQQILKKSPHRVIIGLTTNAMKEDREQCLKVGMKGILAKPLSLKKITRTLRQYVSKQ